MLEKFFDLIASDNVYLFKNKGKEPSTYAEELMKLGVIFKGNEKYIRFGVQPYSSGVEIWSFDDSYNKIDVYKAPGNQIEQMFREDFKL